MADSACRDYLRFDTTDRSLYIQTLRQLARRDPRVLSQVKKMANSNRFERAYPSHGSEFWTARANRELRVVLVPTAKGWQVVGLARKGGSLFAGEW